MTVKTNTAMWTVLVAYVLIAFAGWIILPYTSILIEEQFFGAQGGEMVQMQSSHVSTDSDLDEMLEEENQVKKEIIDMTEYW
jgi:hypothetical protein